MSWEQFLYSNLNQPDKSHSSALATADSDGKVAGLGKTCLNPLQSSKAVSQNAIHFYHGMSSSITFRLFAFGFVCLHVFAFS